MAEIRQNPITKDWVIIASERTKRPDDFKELSSESHLCEYRPDCPSCLRNEKLTPEAILVFSDNMVQGCQCEWGIPTLLHSFQRWKGRQPGCRGGSQNTLKGGDRKIP